MIPKIQIGLGATGELFQDLLLSNDFYNWQIYMIVPGTDCFLVGYFLLAGLTQIPAMSSNVLFESFILPQQGCLDFGIRSQSINFRVGYKIRLIFL